MKNVEDIYSLTPMQHGMLYHTVAAPHSGVYITQAVLTLGGHLDPESLKTAFNLLLARHSALRTCFLSQGLDDPVQVVLNQVILPWRDEDWSALSEEELSERLSELMEGDRGRGFDLTGAPLMRITSINAPQDGHLVLWTCHHLLVDGASFSMLMQELFSLYAVIRQGREPNIAPPRPFRDYVTWLERQNLGDARVFWSTYLYGLSKPTPLYSGPPALDSKCVNRRTLEFSEEFSDELRSAARHHRVTLNTFFQGAWTCLLRGYTGNDDVVYGTTVSGRPPSLEGAEEMIGLFINTLPVRPQIKDGETITAWLQRLQQDLQAIQDFAYTPLTSIQQWSDTPPGEPLFDNILVFESHGDTTDWMNIPDDDLVLEEFRSIEQNNFPVAVLIIPGSRIRILFVLAVEESEAWRYNALLSHFETLCHNMLDEHIDTVAELDMLSDEATSELLQLGTGAATPYPRESTVHGVFEDTVGRQSERTALVCGDTELTYGEVDALSNGWACVLQKQGVGIGDRVLVGPERSIHTVPLLLGVLKCGGIYVPIESSLPLERKRFIYEDVSPALVLVQEPQTDSLWVGRADVLSIEETALDAKRLATKTAPLAAGVNASEGAYIMYTSGSTGRPKGVLVSHSNVVRLARTPDYIEVDPSDRFLQFAPLAFDLSTFEIWVPLLNGATLVVAPPKPTLSELGALLEETQISVLWLTASLFHVLAGRSPEIFCGLRYLLAGGEVVSPDAVRRTLAACPGLTIVNGYGPTEGTTFTCCFPTTDVPASISRLPIGRPIPNTHIIVADDRLRPVPKGVEGELLIGGDGVASGYWNDSDLTEQKFVTLEFGGSGKQRYYRSGDRVRFTNEGHLEFLGRRDHQVKLRGFRIELSEIDDTLARHPSVMDATTLVVGAAAESRRLVSFCVNSGSADIDRDDVLRVARDSLSDYMVPDDLVILDDYPTTSSGKVDRAALETMASRLLERPRNSRTLSTESEIKLGSLWSDLLGVAELSPDDSFYQVGGHSLMLLRLADRMSSEFGKDVTLAKLLDHPVLSDQARWLASLDEHESSSKIPAEHHSEAPVGRPQESDDRVRLFLFPDVGGTSLGLSNIMQHLKDVFQPVYLTAPGLEDGSEPIASIPDLGDHFIEEILHLQPTGPFALVGFSFGGMLAQYVAVRLSEMDLRVGLLVNLDAIPPLSLSHLNPLPRTGRRLRFSLLRTALGVSKGIRGESLPLVYRKRADNQPMLDVLTGQLHDGYDVTEGWGEMSDRMRRTIRTHLAAMTRYEPKVYSGRMHLVRPNIHTLKLLNHRWYSLHTWNDFVSDLRINEVTGTHLDLISEERAADVASIFRSLAIEENIHQ